MSQQYLRNCSLIVAQANGSGIELGALRTVFEVRRGDIQTPNTCDAKIFNLSANTVAQLKGRGATAEFTQLALKVSYQNQPLAQIFYGSIKQVRTGREDQKNSYIAITAADGDNAYNYAPIALTLAAGHTPLQNAQAILANMASFAIFSTPTGGSGGQPLTQGYLAQFNENRAIRGRTWFGESRDAMRQFAQSQDCKWWIDNGQLSVVPMTSYIPGPPVLITPSTGLIGVPEQTQNGLMVRVLLNPAIKIGQTIKLDSTDINELRFGVDLQSQATNDNLMRSQAKLNGDGLYYVMRVEHFGDTRGNSWYSDLTCLSVDASAPVQPVPGTGGILPAAGTISRY